MKKCMLVLMVLLLFIAGCEESHKQGSPKIAKQGVMATLKKLAAAYEKQDVDTVLSFYSDDFEGGNGEDKEQVSQLLNGMKEQGYLADTELDLDDVKLKVEGDTVTAAPVTYSGSWGEVDYKAVFKKEGAIWKTVSTEEYYGG